MSDQFQCQFKKNISTQRKILTYFQICCRFIPVLSFFHADIVIKILIHCIELCYVVKSNYGTPIPAKSPEWQNFFTLPYPYFQF